MPMPCCEEGCPPVDVAASCDLPAVTLDDAAIAAICGAGGGGPYSISMVEVGTEANGLAIACPSQFIPAPNQQHTINLSGLTPGCVVFFNVTWAEIGDLTGCGGEFGTDVQVQSQSGGIGTVEKLCVDASGFNFWQPTLGQAIFYAEVTAGGSASVTFDWYLAQPPLHGQAQIHAFEVCGDIDPANPVSAFVAGGPTMPAGSTAGDPTDPVNLSLPPDDCPTIYLAGQRHSDWVGNPNSSPNPIGGFDTQSGQTEVAEYISNQSQFDCQIGQVGGFDNSGADTLTGTSQMNVSNFFGVPIENQSLWKFIRINCAAPASGGNQIVESCCVDITNDLCNGQESAAHDVSVPVSITADAGSNFAFELLVNGTVEDTFTVDNSGGGSTVTQTGTLNYSGVIGPLDPGQQSTDQCVEIRFVCSAFAGSGNAASTTASTNDLDITV